MISADSRVGAKAQSGPTNILRKKIGTTNMSTILLYREEKIKSNGFRKIWQNNIRKQSAKIKIWQENGGEFVTKTEKINKKKNQKGSSKILSAL